MSSLVEIAKANEILRVVNGSKLYGTNVDSSDDDFISIFVEPPANVFLDGNMKSVSLRDKPEGVRSEAGDVDCVAYSLRHFCHLAANGNPSVLTLLFSPEAAVVTETEYGALLRCPATQERFASKKAVPRFKGYMMKQKERLVGERSGHMPKRPELVEEHGFDSKYAGHVLRLGIQGSEFLSTGKMALPMKAEDVELLVGVRTGKFTFDETIAMIDEVEERLNAAIEQSQLPEEPDLGYISELLKGMHVDYWDEFCL